MSRATYAALLDSEDGIDEELFDRLLGRVASRPLPAPSRVPDVEREQALAVAHRVSASRPRTRTEVAEAVTQRPGRSS